MTFVAKNPDKFFFDRRLEPVAKVQPGEPVVFETWDTCRGEVRSAEQFLAHRRAGSLPGSPLTGPVFVEGAAPGDTLVVDILKVELDADGFQLIGPDRAIIRDEVPDWTCHVFHAEGNRVRFPNGLEVAADPVIGTFGNAPAGDPTNFPNPLGGNLDVPAARTGARLYIPIAAPGALFSLGDVHACQGDGEVVGAPEIGAKVTVRFDVRGGRHSDWLMIEDAAHWHSPCSAETEAEAARRAVFQNARLIERAHAVAFKDALIYLTLAGALSISRTGKWVRGTLPPVVCSSFPKEGLRQALTAYRHAVSPTPPAKLELDTRGRLFQKS